ncbi:MAG: flagellar motor protein MotB [bacterium]|jgi:chemotaxis protein MotB
MRRYSRQRRANNIPTQGWLTTYGDLMTLILVFFVLLFSFSSLDAAKFEAIIHSLQEALGIFAGGTPIQFEIEPTTLSDGKMTAWEQEQLQLERLQSQLESFIQKEGLEGQVIVGLEERGLIVRFFEHILFELGSAQLKEQSMKILDKIATVISDIPNQIRAEGHTDDLPINTYRYPSNWDLSGARASAVIRHLMKAGFSPYQLSFAGYGEFRPIAPNQPAGQPLNRRVDLVILRSQWRNIEPGGLGSEEDID